MSRRKTHGSCIRDQWRDLVASAEGPRRATTRHVLLTLSLHMDPMGGRCFPSIRHLAERTRLSERAVRDNIDRAVAAGWISKRRHKKGQGWRRNEYQAKLPKVSTLGTHVTPAEASTLSTHVEPRGEYSNDQEVGTQGTTNQSYNQSGGSASPPVAAIEAVCRAMGADWDQKSLTPAEWVTQKSADPRFGGLDFATVFLDAADYLSSARCRRKYTWPSLFLLNQLKAEAKRLRESPPNSDPHTDVSSYEDTTRSVI